MAVAMHGAWLLYARPAHTLHEKTLLQRLHYHGSVVVGNTKTTTMIQWYNTPILREYEISHSSRIGTKIRNVPFHFASFSTLFLLVVTHCRGCQCQNPWLSLGPFSFFSMVRTSALSGRDIVLCVSLFRGVGFPKSQHTHTHNAKNKKGIFLPRSTDATAQG